MRARPLVIITTQLPPAACGIGTYSWLLRRHWPDQSQPVEFLVQANTAGANTTEAGDRITSFDGSGARLRSELERIGPADVLLHYAARGYQRFGCPVWLPGAVASWKAKFPAGRLMLFAHEMPAPFPITSHHYWLARVNSWIVRRLARVSDLLVTNSERHAQQLRQISGRQDVYLTLIPSNIEPGAVPLSARAATEFLVFGLEFGRLQTLQFFASHIPRWHAAGLLKKLHLAGPAKGEFAQRAEQLIASWPRTLLVERHGPLQSPAASSLLRRVGFVLTNVSLETWSKSGVFTACAANEAPVVISSARPETIPLCYSISAEEVGSLTREEINPRARSLAEWYRANADWPVIARQIAELWQTRETSRAG